VRTFSHRPARAARALFAASLLAAAAGCAGGSSSNVPNPGSTQICDPDAGSISIARPSPGFPQNGNSIEIVSSSGSDQLHSNPTAFDLILNDNFGQQIVTGLLNLVPDTNGPHPYSSDFFYQGSLGTGLSAGRTYNVFLNAPNSNCTPGFVGQIFT
jgi:hypothetical protein